MISFLFFSYSGFSFKSASCSKNYSKTKICNIIKKLTYPGAFLYRGYQESKEFIKQSINGGEIITTGRVVDDIQNTKERFIHLDPGFTFNYEKGAIKNLGYLILSYSDAKDKEKLPTVEIWDLNNQELIHKYNFDTKALENKFDINLSDTSLRHPLVLEDGSLIATFSGGSAIMKFDKCGKLLDFNDEAIFHHSIEIDDDELIYVGSRLKTEEIDLSKYPNNFYDEGFYILNKDLETIKKYSLIDIYKKNNLIKNIISEGQIYFDPFHLNDVEPHTRSDGSKIVLLSLREQSNLLALDLKSEKIIWIIDNLTSHQHDIDIVGHKNSLIDISIFDNNMYMYKNYVIGENANGFNRYITFKNLPTQFSERIEFIIDNYAYKKYEARIDSFKYLRDKFRPITKTEGRADYAPLNNSLMIEETNNGRIFEIDLETKQIIWEFLNKKEINKANYYMNWSRKIEKLPLGISKSEIKGC